MGPRAWEGAQHQSWHRGSPGAMSDTARDGRGGLGEANSGRQALSPLAGDFDLILQQEGAQEAV